MVATIMTVMTVVVTLLTAAFCQRFNVDFTKTFCPVDVEKTTVVPGTLWADSLTTTREKTKKTK